MLFPFTFAFDKDDRFKGIIEMKFAKLEDENACLLRELGCKYIYVDDWRKKGKEYS